MTTPERGLFERIKAFMVRGKFGAAKAICADVDKKLIDAERRNEPLQIIANSVAAALEQAGFDYVDDPGESISIIAEDRDEARHQIAVLEQRLAEARAKYKDAMADLIFRNTDLKVAHNEIAQLRARCGELENIAHKASAVNAHWNEFGPEHGFDECMNRLNSALTEIQPQPAQEQK